MCNDWLDDEKIETKSNWTEQDEDNASCWGNAEEKETVSEWAAEDDNASVWGATENKETISEWLVDEEQPQEAQEIREEEAVNNRNIFYEVYKFEITSIFDEPRLFHQEHVNKKKINQEVED